MRPIFIYLLRFNLEIAFPLIMLGETRFHV